MPGLLPPAPSAARAHMAGVPAALPCIQVGLRVSLRCLPLLDFVLHSKIENLSQPEVRESYRQQKWQ